MSVQFSRRNIVSLVPPAIRMGKRALSGWMHGEPEIRLLPILCDPRSISVDVGANLGIYTWHLRRFSGGVVAFEPQPDMAAFLERALRNTVVVQPYALSNRQFKVDLRVPIDQSLNGNASVEPTNNLQFVDYSTVTVECRRLDDFKLGKIGFMKIDVEGHELAVLEGAVETLERDQPNLLIEMEDRHRPNAIETTTGFLESLGYQGRFQHHGRICDIRDLFTLDADPGRRAAELGINNFVFLHRSREDRMQPSRYVLEPLG